MNNATVLAPKQALTNVQAIFWGGLIAGVLNAIDGVASTPDRVVAIITEAVDAATQEAAFDPQRIGGRA